MKAPPHLALGPVTRSALVCSARKEIFSENSRSEACRGAENPGRPGAGSRSTSSRKQVASHNILILALKGVAGGSLVTAFALISEGLSPKRFAGLFSAAPAVAIASLAIVLLDKGAHDAHKESVGMLAGAGGMIAYAATAVPLLRRLRAGRAAAAALGAWFLVAAILAVPVLSA